MKRLLQLEEERQRSLHGFREHENARAIYTFIKCLYPIHFTNEKDVRRESNVKIL